jgi:2-isopropylmalate synthase
MEKNRIIIFDTTLRDGEQCPGASLNTREKLEIAHQLALLKVDIIEAGFPIASPGDFEAVSIIAKEVKGVKIAGLARALEKDIDAAARALEKAKKPRIHVFLATSKIHRDYKLKKAKLEIITQAVKSIKYAKKFADDIEFSPEDASRTEPDFLNEVVEAVIDCGATTINIPDTVGYALPVPFAALIKNIKENVPNINNAVISVHCHNDLGLAVANSLSAIKAGARQVECTINGLGERAGNAAMEELVMTLKTRNDFFDVSTRIQSKRFVGISKLVANLTGLFVQRNKAIVGANAFAHEAGIHQHGIMSKRATYEIMHPKDVGWEKSNLVIGKHSGKHAFVKRIKEIGFKLSKEKLKAAFDNFKLLADEKKEIYDEDLIALVENQLGEEIQYFSLKNLKVPIETEVPPQAEVSLKLPDNSVKKAISSGDGPVDAIFKAIDKITKLSCRLADYQIRAVTKGKDALGEVSLQVEHKKQKIHGKAAGTDIVETSARAYLNAINRLVKKQEELQ